jgi:hypothetical protein
MPSFDFITDPIYKSAVSAGYRVVSEKNLWDWLKTYQPEKLGYMFCTDANVMCIADALHPLDLSRFQFGVTMRMLDEIAKKGMEYSQAGWSN